MDETLKWLGIAVCVTQSASFSGLNLAVFSLSRLRLEAAAESGDRRAARVLALRRDANFTLVTILLGNVGINVLLTLLAESLMAGVLAFLFSTVVITVVGEIVPQAYFKRHALRVAALLAPLLRFYRVLLWPVARPAGVLLDRWIGAEGVPWFREGELRDVLMHHARSAENEVGRIEATGAANFLALDDVPVAREGEPVDPDSVLTVEFDGERPRFPDFRRTADDEFLRRVQAPGCKWLVLTDAAGEPRLVLNSHVFLRAALFGAARADPLDACHRPLVVRDADTTLGHVLGELAVEPEHPADDVVDQDVILFWSGDAKRIITGADLLGRLLWDIVRVRA